MQTPWSILGGIAVAIVVAIASVLLEPLAVPVRRTLRRVYAPPHGSVALAATWFVAILAFTVAFAVDTLSTGARVLGTLGAPAWAFVASLMTRDEYRAAATVQTDMESDRLGWFMRTLALLLGALCLASGIAFVLTPDLRTVGLGQLVGGVVLLVVGIRGRGGWFLGGSF